MQRSLRNPIHRIALFLAVLGGAIVATSTSAMACGGFFCLNDPVDQTGERIVFTVNDDGTITTLIEILYQGAAEDFSWILPIPEAIAADDLQVPEDGQDVFDELHRQTDVQIIAPPMPDCAQELLMDMAMADDAMEESGVDIFASGEVGPFGFDVVGSEDPNALIDWLRDSNYQVTEPMVPLIDHYVDQQMAFVAMRLLDGETAESITPIEITYGGTEPMIPLVLTAVAAQPNMPVWVWIFGDERAISSNYADLQVATEELSFTSFGGNDYTFLVQQRANALDGQAFITEFAGASSTFEWEHPWLQEQAAEQPYLTRLNTYIDPEEMTVDPVFTFDGSLPDVSNVRDATELQGLYGCERDGDGGGILDSIFGGAESDAIDPRDGGAQVVAFTPGVGSAATDESTPSTSAVAQADDAESDDGAEAAEEETTSSWFVWFAVAVAFFGSAVAFTQLRSRKN
jgi:hypothetical protein